MSFNDLKKQCESNRKAESDIKSFENVKKEIESNKKQEEEKLSIEKRLKNEMTETEKEKS